MKTQFPYRLAAIDLDDTLLGPGKDISAENRAAVSRLRAAGVTVVLASGRRRENMRRYHLDLGLPETGLILSSQGAVVGPADGSGPDLHHHGVPADLASEVVRAGAAAGLNVIYYHDSGTYTQTRDSYTELYERRSFTVLETVEDLRQFDGVEPQKLLWVGPPARLIPLQRENERRWQGLLEVMITDPEYLEFMAHGANKAEGLAVAAGYYNVPQSETLAFGDGTNDVAMLRWAGCGVAMDGGRPDAIAVADRVSPAGSAETSLARGINALFDSWTP
jgi:Cof subfamily protein (haloacid dehalogenase superfamily)